MSPEHSKTVQKPDPDAGEAPAPDSQSAPGPTPRVRDAFNSTTRAMPSGNGRLPPAPSAARSRRNGCTSWSNPALSLADDAPTPFDTVRANPLGTKKGYDPYDSGKLGKRPEAPRKKDLRKLSEFMKLKKQAAENKDE